VSETIKQSELRNNNAEIMRRVADGESFTVTVHGQPVADLVPYQRRPHHMSEQRGVGVRQREIGQP